MMFLFWKKHSVLYLIVMSQSCQNIRQSQHHHARILNDLQFRHKTTWSDKPHDGEFEQLWSGRGSEINSTKNLGFSKFFMARARATLSFIIRKVRLCHFGQSRRARHSTENWFGDQSVRAFVNQTAVFRIGTPLCENFRFWHRPLAAQRLHFHLQELRSLQRTDRGNAAAMWNNSSISSLVRCAHSKL